MVTSSHNYRAFPRDCREAKIVYSVCHTEKYYTARMCNCSAGGMYFESEHNGLKPGADIMIRMVDYVPELHGSEAKNGYRAEVMWCRDMSQENRPHYGFGVRFMVNKCDHCGGKFPPEDIHKTEKMLFLCSECLWQLESIPAGELRGNVENYLMGNVI